MIDPRFDHAVFPRRELRFTRAEAAEDFARAEYEHDAIPRAVHRLPDSLHAIIELPIGAKQRDVAREIIQLAGGCEVFYIESMPGEG